MPADDGNSSSPASLKTNDMAVVSVVCAWCKRQRDGDGRWNRPVEMNVEAGEFVSHGICPGCLNALPRAGSDAVASPLPGGEAQPDCLASVKGF